uniref:Uncharacterized protein n=1 Tax=Romanomermis culicivorax TaxID=13658 RepID=A0A915K4G4_ROMCU
MSIRVADAKAKTTGRKWFGIDGVRDGILCQSEQPVGQIKSSVDDVEEDPDPFLEEDPDPSELCLN